MPQSPRDHGEFESSTEYLKEYGGLIIDISTLVDTLEHALPSRSEVRSFSIERIEDPIELPDSIFKAIGEVSSATVSYDTQDVTPTISIELYGKNSTYIISRSQDTKEPVDSIVDIPPVDPFTHALLGISDHMNASHTNESSEEFEKRIHNIEGVSNAEFIRLLLTLAQPNATIESTPDTTKLLENINPFESSIYQSFIESSSVTSYLENAFFEYDFVADDTAALAFSQENGHPSYFQFICTDPCGETLRVRGTINKTMELDFPQHAIKKGIHQDLVDTTLSFPLTLSEIKYIRELLQDEIASMPKHEALEELAISEDALSTIDTASLDYVETLIDNEREERALEDQARYDSLNDELAKLINDEDNTNT